MNNEWWSLSENISINKEANKRNDKKKERKKERKKDRKQINANFESKKQLMEIMKTKKNDFFFKEENKDCSLLFTRWI